MDNFRNRLIHLHHCRGITWKTIYYFLKQDPQLKSLSKDSPYLMEHSPVYSECLSDLNCQAIREQIRQYPSNQIHAITIFDDEYPALLKEIYQPPWVIYAKGDISLLQTPRKLAVVGSRESTAYGERAIKYLFPKLIENDYVIVSGLAKGIDALAHRYAIEYKGRTIGVIAGGFYHLYPKETAKLAVEMMRTQLVISEYPPDTRPTKWQFPMRNRIISGLTSGTLVIEAKKKSGSLITANYALNEGREVFALPGSIFSIYSLGTNELIQQGAKMVIRPEDIFEEFSF
ncbi:DNA protecting protein DprA [Bacillus methanolicus PB1]|uniref:DNA protecting protein DprA n=1 Tax=Bacillus methanolicus PB1 TaxID=997296 RepID=I3E4U1_BACMT|nr:DNA-processing protein DprA [Bacillus methanolicus]EIJ81512.1 DNA protecting protein DprA [Bacillus methanolicus PB1]